MEFVEAIRKGDPGVFLSRISKIHQKQDDHFQEILRDLEFKFEELKDFENFEIEIDEKIKSVKEPKRKRAAGASKLLPNDTVCTTDMKEPLGSSTPTETSSTTSSNKENCTKESSATSKTSIPVPKTPSNEFKCPMRTESVKKRIEEFEKRAAAAASSSGSKIPVLTPVKKKNFVVPTSSNNLTTKLIREARVKPQIYTEKTKEISSKTQIYVEKLKEVQSVKPRLTRNTSKILREKNTNIKTSKERAPDPPIKKAAAKKASTDETRRKKEETAQKASVNKEALEKQKRIAALKEQHEKEKEAKIQAVQKQKEEKLLLLKKKQLGTAKLPEINEKKLEENAPESYDIDDVTDEASTDEEDNPTKKIPLWATKKNRKHQLCAQAWIDKKNTVFLWFYNRYLKYPKVEELFSVDVKTRPRTSSAMWNNSSICS